MASEQDHGPLYFFQQDECEFVRRRRKSYSLIEKLEGNLKDDKSEVVISQEDESLEVRKSNENILQQNSIAYQKELVNKIEEDARVFTHQCSITPSLHKFLPLLKQAIQTFDSILPSNETKSLHGKYLNIKVFIPEIIDEINTILNDLHSEEVKINKQVIPSDLLNLINQSWFSLIQNTVVEYPEWQIGQPDLSRGDGASPKIASQVSEIAFSIDGSRSGKSRYCKNRLWSEEDTGTSSKSNDGTSYTGSKRDSYRRKNLVSDQSDLIEDHVLESLTANSHVAGDNKASNKKKDNETHPHNTTISFSLLNKTCVGKGWIISQGEKEINDKSIVRYLLEKLKKAKMAKAIERKNVLQSKYPYELRYFVEADNDLYRSKRPFTWANRHKVGFVTEVPQDNKSQFLFAFNDGSTTIYYHSGSICCIISNCPYPKEQDCTRTINVFHHNNPDQIIASFNPSGTGSVWYDNTHPAFISTILGGCIFDKDGIVTKSWSWHYIDFSNFTVSVNEYLSVVVTSRGSVNLHLILSEECVTVNVKSKLVPGDEVIQNATPVLLSGFQFKSNSAKAILSAPKTRMKRKMRQKRVSSSRTMTEDWDSSAEVVYTHKHFLPDATDRYLINNTRKVIRNVEDILTTFKEHLEVLADTSDGKISEIIKPITLQVKLPPNVKTTSSVNICSRATCIRVYLNKPPYLVLPNKSATKTIPRSASTRARSSTETRHRKCPKTLKLFIATGEKVREHVIPSTFLLK